MCRRVDKSKIHQSLKLIDSEHDYSKKVNSDFKFSDIFDLAEIQKIQDAFSAATGVASIITEVDGTPITKPSNFCRFCMDIVRKTEKGLKNCMISDSIIGSPKKDGPRIQKCLSGGLLDGGASIMLGDKHIANWLIGQVLDTEYPVDEMLGYADEIGVERSLFEDALDNVTRMPRQQFTDICNYLFLSARQLSKLAVKSAIQAGEIEERKVVEEDIRKQNDELESMVLERTCQLEELNAELEETNSILEEEIAERQKAEEEIRRLNQDLEKKVLARTNELQEMNTILEEEISEKTHLHERLKKYQILAEKANDAMIFLDREGNILEVNEAAMKIYGYNSEEFAAMSIFDLRRPEKTPEILGQMQAADEKGVIFETIHYLKNGNPINVEVSSQGAFLGNKRVLLSIIRDITERKKAEQEIIREKEKAEAANLAKSQFLANMSHEIRTPMNGIIGMTDLVLMTDLDEKQRKYLNIVKLSTTTLLRVLNDILDYSKIEAGKVDLDRAPFSINKVTKEVVDLFSIAAEQKNIKLKFDISGKIPQSLIGDSVRLRQILSNLVGNGIKFTSDGQVAISVDIEDKNESNILLRFDITDTGIGIPENKLDKLFKRFSQVDDSNTREFGGSGLGLAISKKLVEMMGGTIGVESRENDGSRFFFTAEFGIAADELPLQKVNPQAAPCINSEYIGSNVLLADDDEVSRRVMVILLKKMGFEVVVAGNGEEAVEKYKDDTFDLILMDINMPVIDGFTATSIIRSKEKRHTPIIAITAYALSGDREKVIKAGMDDYISKPVDIDQVARKIRSWIEKRRRGEM